jgi:multidrug resistance protein, MATE family
VTFPTNFTGKVKKRADIDVYMLTVAYILMPVVCVAAQPVDGLNSLVHGVLQGVGRQGVAAVCNLVSYWGVGLPLAAALTFTAGEGVRGLWIGVLAGTGLAGG